MSEERIQEARRIVHRLANDLSGVKGLVDLYTSGFRPELDMDKVSRGLARMERTLTELRMCLHPER